MFLSAVASHNKTLINHNIQNILIIIIVCYMSEGLISSYFLLVSIEKHILVILEEMAV
jgi:hypothetical protein